MSLVYVMVFGSVAVFGITAVYGLLWALRNGQLGDFAGGAASIFDEEEPVGRPTDAFPARERAGEGTGGGR